MPRASRCRTARVSRSMREATPPPGAVPAAGTPAAGGVSYRKHRSPPEGAPMPETPYNPFADGDDEYDDEYGGEQEEGAEGESGDARPAVFVTTAQPVPLRVDRIEDERAPEGAVLGAYINGRLVARSAMDRESLDRLLSLDLFSDPVPLGLFAYEEEPGLQCRLFALVPSGTLREAADAEEPWKASVPSYEERTSSA